MCKIKFTNPILHKFALTLTPDGLVDNVDDFVIIFNDSDRLYKLDNLELKLVLDLSVNGNLYISDANGNLINESNGEFVYPTILEPLPPETPQVDESGMNELIAWESGLKTSTDSADIIDGEDVIKNDAKTQKRESIFKELQGTSEYVFVNIPDSANYYIDGFVPDEFHTILVVLHQDNVKENMTIQDIVGNVPDWAKWGGKPFPISLEYKHTDEQHKYSQHGKREHTERINIRATQEGRPIEDVTQDFINEFEEVQSTKRLVKESNKYAIYPIRKVSKGVVGTLSEEGSVIPESYFKTATLLDGVTVLATGEVVIKAKETLDEVNRQVNIELLPNSFKDSELDFIFDNAFIDNKFNKNIIPTLQFLLGNKPNREDFGITHNEGLFTVHFTLENGSKFHLVEGTVVSDETIAAIRERFNTIIKRNYSLTLSNKFQSKETTIEEAIDYLKRNLQYDQDNILIGKYLKSIGLDLDSTLQEYTLTKFTPKYQPAKIKSSGGAQLTYQPVNKYAYLHKPTIQDVGVELGELTNLVNEKSKNTSVARYETVEDLAKAYELSYGEPLPKVLAGQGVNWFDGETIHLDPRDKRPYIETEERIHALTAKWLNTNQSANEYKQLKKVADDIKSKVGNSTNKAIWDDIFSGSEERQLAELIARGTTYPELIKELKGFDVEDKSLWDLFIDKIQDIVNNILGSDNNNYYELLVSHTVSIMEAKPKTKLSESKKLGDLFGYFDKEPIGELSSKDVRDGLDYLFTGFINLEDSGLSFANLGEKYNLKTKVEFREWLKDYVENYPFLAKIDIEDWFNDKESKFQFTPEDSTDVELESLEIKEEEGTSYEGERGTSTRIQERLTNRIRDIFTLIPETDSNGDIVRNTRTNLPNLSTLSEVVQDIYAELSGILDESKILSKIETLSKTNKKFKALYAFMDLADKPYSDLARSFYGLLQANELKLLKAVISTVDEITYENVYVESGENTGKIHMKWNSNLKENFKTSGNFIEVEGDYRFTQEFKDKLDAFVKSPELQSSVRLFKAFGITLSPKTIEAINSDESLRDKLKEEAKLLTVLETHLKRLKDYGGKDSLNTANQIFKGTAFYTSIEKLESEYSHYRKATVTRNAKGDLISVYTLPNTAIIQRNLLEQFRESLDLDEGEINLAVQGMLRNITDVKFPASLREKLLSGEVQIEIYNLEGFKEGENESTSNLANYSYIKQQSLFWKNKGTLEFQRTETGSSAWGYRFVKKGVKYTKPYINNNLSHKGAIERALPIFKEFFIGEIEKLRLLQSNPERPFGEIGTTPTKKLANLERALNDLMLTKEKATNAGIVFPNVEEKIKVITEELAKPHIPGNYNPFQIFGFLPLATRAKLIENNESYDIDTLWKGIENIVRMELQSSIDAGVNAIQEYKGELGEGITPASFLLNYKIHQSYSTLLHYGDGNWFGKFFKRAKGVVSTGTARPFSQQIYESITPQMANVFNPTKGNIKVKVAAIKDVNRAYDKNGIDFKELKANAIESIDSFLANQNISPEFKATVKANLVKGIDAYKQEINVGDGQSWVSLDIVQTMLRGNDLWETQGLDKLYEYEVNFLSILKQLGIDKINELEAIPEDFKTDSDREGIAKLKEYRQALIEHNFDVLPLTDEQKKVLKDKPKGNWQSEKWQYFGNIEEYAEYNPIVFLKTSFAPLAPSEIIGTPMESVMFNMYKTNTQILASKSAMKGAIADVGAASLGDGFNDIEGREFHIYMPYMKEQLKSNHKVKKENLLATQFIKLLFSDTKDGDKKWHSQKTRELYARYLKTLDNIRNVEEAKLLQELNITKKNGRYIVNDKESIKDVLIGELKRRSKNAEITERQVEFLRNLEGDVNFDYTGMAQTLSEILAGYIKKRLVRIKLPGNALILKSSLGVDESLKFYKYNKDGVSKAEAKIAMQGTFKKLLNRPEVIEAAITKYGEAPSEQQLVVTLNTLISEESIPEKLITIFGYRIPTSGINLMDSYVIKEFLPSSAGNTIIVPKESVVKAGEDFDIDKKNFYFPSFTNDGQLIEAKDSITFPLEKEELKDKKSDIKRGLKKLKQQGLNLLDWEEMFEGLGSDSFAATFARELTILEDKNKELLEELQLVNKALKEYKDYTEHQIGAYTNDLIDVASQAITQPERYFSLVAPVTTDFLESTLGKTAKPDTPPNHRNTNFETILKKRLEMVLAGQKLTGFAATDSVAIQLFLQHNLSLNTSYVYAKDFKTQQPKYRKVVFPITYFSNPPKVKDGKYDLNSLYTQDGYLKSELFNQLVQATIDAATASILAPVNITKDTLSIYQYLTAVVGLKLGEVTEFITQKPIKLRQLFLEQGLDSKMAYVETVRALGEDSLISYSKSTGDPFVDWEAINSNHKSYSLFLFNEYRKQANEYLSVKQAINFDTKPDRTAMDAEARVQLIEKLEEPNFFPASLVKNVLDKSAVSSKLIIDLTKDVYEAFTPIRANKDFIAKVLSKEDEFWTSSKTDRFRRIAQNDFQEWLIKNYLKIGEISFPEYYKSIGGNIWNRIDGSKYTHLADNFFLNKEENGIQHIHVTATAKDDGSVEGIQKDFLKMKEEDPQLLHDLIVTSIGQSGFNISPFTWTSMLPEQSVFDLIKDAVKKAENDLNKRSKFVTTIFMSSFLAQPDNQVFLNGGEYENIPKYMTTSNLSNEAYNRFYGIKEKTKETTKVIEKVNKEIEKHKHSFTHNGITIPTNFELSPDQVIALEKLVDYTEKGNTTNGIVLSGAPGVGKTSIIGYLEAYFKKKGGTTFAYSAFTLAATAQLAKATVRTGNTKMPSTIRSSFKKDRKTGKYGFAAKVNKQLNLGFNKVFVVDEVSMLPNYDLAIVKEAAKNDRVKLIFLGDFKQIPEVSSQKPKQVSKSFTDFEQINLTKVHRQDTGDMLNTLTAMRGVNNFELFKPEKNSDEMKVLDIHDFEQELVKDLQNDIENTKIITYTKAGVSRYNQRVRNLLGFTGDPQVGEMLVGYGGYYNKQIKNLDLVNSIAYKIENIERVTSVMQIKAVSPLLRELRELGVDVKDTSRSNYLQLSSEDSLKFSSLTTNDFKKNNEFLTQIFRDIHNLNQRFKRKEIKYWDWRDSIVELTQELASYNTSEDYIYNPVSDTMEVFSRNRHKHLIDFQADQKGEGQMGTLLMTKGVDFGYAVNSHKAQGATLGKVYYDMSDLGSAPNAPIMKEGVQVTTEKQSLAYVSMSRASQKLVVYPAQFGMTTIPTNLEEETPIKTVEETSSNIYSKLGNKTKSENVVIQSVYQRNAIDFAKSVGGLTSMRLNHTDNNFGNPFSSVPSEIAKGLIPTKSTKESVETYIDWVSEDATPISKYGIDKKVFAEKILLRTGAKKTSKGMFSLDGQYYYSKEVSIEDKGDFKDLFLYLGNEEVYLGSSPKNSNKFTSQDNFVLQDFDILRNMWIKKQLETGKLKEKPIHYYKELGEPSHATALDYLINKHNWREPKPTPQEIFNSDENLDKDGYPIKSLEEIEPQLTEKVEPSSFTLTDGLYMTSDSNYESTHSTIHSVDSEDKRRTSSKAPETHTKLPNSFKFEVITGSEMVMEDYFEDGQGVNEIDKKEEITITKKEGKWYKSLTSGETEQWVEEWQYLDYSIKNTTDSKEIKEYSEKIEEIKFKLEIGVEITEKVAIQLYKSKDDGLFSQDDLNKTLDNFKKSFDTDEC